MQGLKAKVSHLHEAEATADESKIVVTTRLARFLANIGGHSQRYISMLQIQSYSDLDMAHAAVRDCTRI